MTTRRARSNSDMPRPTRSRDAAASKQALLDAARALFGQRGFEGTTIRDIGERAGVDAALIARYFGSKADLYVAALVAEAQRYQPPPAFEGLNDIARAVLTLTDEQGLGPVTQALIRSDTSADIRAAAEAHIGRRLVAPMATDMTRRGSDRPELRAAIVVSALMGINLGRALGWFDTLSTVPREELVELITSMLDSQPPVRSGQRAEI
ncbi:MAG: Transcriptional regulator, TetR family [Acidimicrobiaceae bacterium]|jgi:AcrR family transcriptional regulator|nr:Transcriptional regulator, TetR family [Acidimicrobiaceae bacterium]